MGTFALRRGESADSEFLLRDDLDFQPFAAALGFVEAGAIFGDQAFEPVLAGGFQHLLAGPGEGGGNAEYGIWRDHLLKEFAALVEAHSAQIVSVEVEQIEREIY